MSTEDKPLEGDVSGEIVSDLSDAVLDKIGKIEVGMGHPNDPNRGQLLSVEDEKRLDDKGEEIASGLLWSEARTGLYLVIGVTSVTPKVNCPLIGGSHTNIPKALVKGARRNLKLTVAVTLGRPTFDCPVWGACLELPSDLGRDHVKQQYIAEWLAETAVEAMAEAGVNFKRNPKRTDEIGLWVSAASNAAINKAGL